MRGNVLEQIRGSLHHRRIIGCCALAESRSLKLFADHKTILKSREPIACMLAIQNSVSQTRTSFTRWWSNVKKEAKILLIRWVEWPLAPVMLCLESKTKISGEDPSSAIQSVQAFWVDIVPQVCSTEPSPTSYSNIHPCKFGNALKCYWSVGAGYFVNNLPSMTSY